LKRRRHGVREEYDRTGSTELAAVRGIGRTGRLLPRPAAVSA
jgi:hypothetical protein